MNTSIVGAIVEGDFAGIHSFSFSNGVRDGVAESQLFLLYRERRAGWEKEINFRKEFSGSWGSKDWFLFHYSCWALLGKSAVPRGMLPAVWGSSPTYGLLMSHDRVCVWSGLALISPQHCLIPSHLACWASPPVQSLLSVPSSASPPWLDNLQNL